MVALCTYYCFSTFIASRHPNSSVRSLLHVNSPAPATVLPSSFEINLSVTMGVHHCLNRATHELMKWSHNHALYVLFSVLEDIFARLIFSPFFTTEMGCLEANRYLRLDCDGRARSKLNYLPVRVEYM